MKYFSSSCFLLVLFFTLAGCKKEGAYPGATISPFIAIYDVKDLYKGTDLALTKANLFGSAKITGLVVSDHSGGNLPAGLLVVQDRRRLGQLRGISLAIGAGAAAYAPGDSVVIDIEGGVLKRVDGILQITGVNAAAVQKISSGNAIPLNRVPASQVLAEPDKYESTLSVIVKGGFNPLPGPNEVLAGDRQLNDGFGDIILHTAASANFANTPSPFLANYYGIVFNKLVGEKQLQPRFYPRRKQDIVVLSSSITIAPVVITGFISDVAGSDGNYEYMQFMATRDIDFSQTPFSVVVTNNANASTPTGYPVAGWATGSMRTYKININSGVAAKGSFFYVGGTNKLINGPSSASISAANWVKNYDYVNKDGEDFGAKTGGLFANSGNASGFAIFQGTTVTSSSVPVDVMFVGNGGSLYAAAPAPAGYRVTNNDWYDSKNPVTLEDQPFYRSGSNTLNMAYTTADLGYFYKLGGEYNVTLGRWMKARSQTNVLLTKQSALRDIEGDGATRLLQ